VHSLDSASEGNRYLGEKGVASVDEKDKDDDEANQHPQPRQRLALPRDAAMGMGMDCPLAATAVTMRCVPAAGHLGRRVSWPLRFYGGGAGERREGAAPPPENVGKGWRRR
jgi:hypothetical protein